MEALAEQRRHNWKSMFWGLISVALVAMVCTTISAGDFPDVRLATHLSAIVFLCTLLGFWMGVGSGGVRFVTALLGALVVGAIFTLSVGANGGVLCLVFCIGITLIAGITALVVRAISGDLAQLDHEGSADKSLQFGIIHLLIWTTVVAMVMPILRWIDFGGGGRDLEIVITLIVTYSLVAAIRIWTFLQIRFGIRRLVAICILVAFAAALPGVLFGNSVFWVGVTLLSQCMVAFSLFSLRMQDYRFVREATTVFG